MFKALPMKKIKVMVLDSYLEKVMNMLGGKGTIEITEITDEGIALAEGKDMLDGYSDVLNRINRLVDVLGVSDSKVEKVTLQEKPSKDYLKEINDTVNSIFDDAMQKNDRLVEITNEGKRLETEKIALKELEKLDIDTNWLGDASYLYTTAGFIEEKNTDELAERVRELTDEKDIILNKTREGEKTLTVISALKEHKAELENTLRSLRFEALDLKGKKVESLETREKEIKKETTELKDALEKIKTAHNEDILIAKEIAEIEKNNHEKISRFGKTERVYLLEGWVPGKNLGAISNEIDDITEGCNIITSRDPEEGENVPVSFNNPKWIKPFETVTDMFGLPAYDEVDPTPLMALTFPIFFGMMFGDVGHGALFALIGLIMTRIKKTESFWKFGMLLFYCGLGAMFFGFMYGSAFGDEAILPELYHTYGVPELFEQIGLDKIGLGNIIEAEHNGHIVSHWIPWKSPVNELSDFIGITMFFGVLQMALGFIVGIVNELAEKGFKGAAHPALKLWFLIGEAGVIGTALPFSMPLISNSGIDTVGYALMGMAIPAALMILLELTHILGKFSVKAFLGVIGNGLFEIFELASMFLSNTISYTRLLILAVVHAMMMLAVYKIAALEMLSGIAFLSLVIIVFGNIFVFVMEGVIVFIHALRLHFYEWFNKFYSAGGVAYKPFIVERRYTELP